MNLKTQKRIAAKVLNCSPKRVVFDSASSQDIKDAITRADIRNLVKSNVVTKVHEKNTSRSRARKIAIQKAKGRKKGTGSRKGKHSARLPSKRTWIAKVRLQRSFVKELKDKKLISPKTYRDVYAKIQGGYFRNKRHIKLYLEEQSLFTK